MMMSKEPAPRGHGRRPVMHREIYDLTVSELHVGHRPQETLPLNRHLHELWQVLGLDDEDNGEEPIADEE